MKFFPVILLLLWHYAPLSFFKPTLGSPFPTVYEHTSKQSKTLWLHICDLSISMALDQPHGCNHQILQTRPSFVLPLLASWAYSTTTVGCTWGPPKHSQHSPIYGSPLREEKTHTTQYKDVKKVLMTCTLPLTVVEHTIEITQISIHESDLSYSTAQHKRPSTQLPRTAQKYLPANFWSPS